MATEKERGGSRGGYTVISSTLFLATPPVISGCVPKRVVYEGLVSAEAWLGSD
jgi:hypothetical protein